MRVDYYKEFPAGAEAMVRLERAVRSGCLEPGLLELVKIRASQINGCTYINGWNRLAVGLRSDVLSLDGLDLPGGAAQQAGPGGAAR